MDFDKQPYYKTQKEEVEVKDSVHRALPKESA